MFALRLFSVIYWSTVNTGYFPKKIKREEERDIEKRESERASELGNKKSVSQRKGATFCSLSTATKARESITQEMTLHPSYNNVNMDPKVYMVGMGVILPIYSYWLLYYNCKIQIKKCNQTENAEINYRSYTMFYLRDVQYFHLVRWVNCKHGACASHVYSFS